MAQGPIALCEVQAYVYGAKRHGAMLAGALGHHALAGSLQAQAVALRRRFEEMFWCEDLSTYALALDGAKQPCRVIASNAGHALLTGNEPVLLRQGGRLKGEQAGGRDCGRRENAGVYH